MSTANTENVACPLGCKAEDEVVLRGVDMLNGLPGLFTVQKCTRCGLMRTNPRPTAEAMSEFYPEDYGPYLGTRINDNLNPPSWGRRVLGQAARRVFNFNSQRLPELPPGRMLEVGCASGSFLHVMSNAGWDVHGIELSDGAAAMARDKGYQVQTGTLEETDLALARFSLIVGWMVLEHLYDPVGGLKKLASWADRNAYLVLSVPNAGSYEFRVFRDRWYALQLPTHLHHFTPQTVTKILEAGGWRVEKIHHQRLLSNLIASTGYIIRDRGFRRIGSWLIRFPAEAGRWNYVLFPVAWLLSCFGQTGRMTIWARKVST